MTVRWKATLIFVACFALYFITRGLGLDEWDAVQFAMGTRQFDLWQHQPQPPGYPLFIFFGRALQHLFGCGPDLSLHLMSCLGGALFVASWFLIVRMQFEELAAWLVAGSLAITPIVWMTATRAMTDSPAAGLLSAQLLCALHYRQINRSGDLFRTALLGAVTTGVRPGLIVIVLIIGALAVWRQGLKVWISFFALLFSRAFCG